MICHNRRVRLFVCYGTWQWAPRPGGHPCGSAYRALKKAGYEPEVVRTYGLGALPGIFNQTPGRREVHRHLSCGERELHRWIEDYGIAPRTAAK